MRALGSILFVIAILSLTQDGLGQRIQKKVKFRRVEANSKISNSSITSILQDSKGFLWVGTDDGLNRYDGYDFKVYRNIENDTTSLVKNKIQSIFEDSRGTLWISTLNSGLHRYNRALDVFNRVSEFSIQHCQVFRIIEDFDHNVWIGGILNAHAFVAMQDHKTGAWKKFLLFPTTDPVYSMLQNSEDEFWLGTRLNGLYKWNRRTNALEQYLHDPANANSLPGDYIEKIKKDANGNLWIATRTGLSKFDSQTKKYKNFVARLDETKTSIPTNAIMDICLDGKYLWIATENGGLSRMDLETESFTNFFYDKNDPTSIINNSIWSLHKDHHGRLWVGSYAKGLCVLDTNEEKFSVVNIHLENDLVNAILKDSKGRLWIGTEEGLLLIDKNTTHHFRHNPKNKNSLSSDAVNCLFEDSKHRIWSGHWGGGINRFDENSGTFVRYLPDPMVKGSLSNPNVFSIAESSKTGELLVSTFGGFNIFRDEQAGIFENPLSTIRTRAINCPYLTRRQ